MYGRGKRGEKRRIKCNKRTKEREGGNKMGDGRMGGLQGGDMDGCRGREIGDVEWVKEGRKGEKAKQTKGKGS